MTLRRRARVEGWERRLSDTIEEWRNEPFSWGLHDCTTFAAAIVGAVSGQSLRPWWAGRYSTATGARRHLRRMGYRTLAEAVSAMVMTDPVPPEQAGRGDLVMLPGGFALGVCIGDRALVLSDAGLAPQPMSAAIAAWRI